MNAAPLTYKYDMARAYAASKGMAWDAESAARADATFATCGLDQRQVDCVMVEHVDAIERAFAPARYSRIQRIMIGLHFWSPAAARTVGRIFGLAATAWAWLNGK